MIYLAPSLTETVDWGCHVQPLPHHFTSSCFSVSLAKAVIKRTADFSAASPRTTADCLLHHQLLAVVGFLLFNYGGITTMLGGFFRVFPHNDVLVPNVL